MSRSARTRPGSRLVAATVLGLAALTAFPAPAGAVPAAPPGTIPGAWIVTLDEEESAVRVSNEHSRQHGARVDHVYQHALRGYAARMSEQTAARVAQDSRVASVERDRVVTASAQTVPMGIKRIDGALSTTNAGNGRDSVDVDVAVIDTGIAKHPDLNLVPNSGRNCLAGKMDDGSGHGTHVAGTIGAKDDNVGVVGVAPGARLHAVRVLNSQGSGSWSSIICGVDWVTANAATIEVANMSLGGEGTAGTGCESSSLRKAICASVDARVTYVVAAGNDAANAAMFVPAAYPEVVTVSALADFDGKAGGAAAPTCRTDVDDTFADFSNYGADVDLIAPGVCINSTWKGGGYNTISGTSMASPHVAGAAALFKAGNPGASPATVQSELVRLSKLSVNSEWLDAESRDAVQETLLNVDAL